jgi:hypothetical protein
LIGNVFEFSGEIVDTGILIKSRKIFDDTADSGISESSITSEVHKDMSGLKSLKIKTERESSVESSSSREKIKKSQKRKALLTDSDSDAPPPSIKKVKVEPLSQVEEPIVVQRIKREKMSDSDDSSQRSVKKPKSNLPSTSKDSSKEKKSKKKKNKSKDDSDEDDFETSLQQLLSSAIKTRK